MTGLERRMTVIGLAIVVTASAPWAFGGTTEATGVTGAGAPPDYTAADVRFMQDMIVHHAQAVEMTDLVPDRAAREDVRLMARRMAISQQDELDLMRRWLAARGERIPDRHVHGGHAAHAHASMPGMLSPGDMARLAGSSGETFDRLFLELMIHHHEGALAMVELLFAENGAGQEPGVFQVASHIDSDQRIEIARMRRMLESDG